MNRHGPCGPQDFKSCASTNSATPAVETWRDGYRHRSLRRRPDSNRCIKVLQTSPLPLGYVAVNAGSPGITWPVYKSPATWWDWGRRGHFKEKCIYRDVRCDYRPSPAPKGRAGNGIRTRDINLGKVALYQLSYSRIGKRKIGNQPVMCKS